MTHNVNVFSDQVLDWFDQFGRKDLPWQIGRTPYRVWLSEIMLQQTQVVTVIPYFNKFLERFPELGDLASAPIDEVLSYWSGLGYYTRARNLHKAARQMAECHNAQVPSEYEALIELPGIGRSTAGAILAQAYGKRCAILDGNVKRVLARYHAVDGWSGKPAVSEKLWQFAELHTPANRVADYTQAIMDLGATVCTKSRPRCDICPVSSSCEAFSQNRVKEFPAAKPRKITPVKSCRMLMVTTQDGYVLLEKRPPSGIWGGLWSFPESGDLVYSDEARLQQAGITRVLKTQEWRSVRHTFSHFHLDITPVVIQIDTPTDCVMEPDRYLWYKARPAEVLPGGVAAPVKRLLETLTDEIGV